MALSDLFTSSAQDQASAQQRQTLLTGLGASQTALQGGYGAATGDISTGYANALQQLAAGYGAAAPQLTSGYGTAMSQLEGARGYYAPLTPGATNAWQQYANLVGAGDPSQVQATLESQPGFQTQMDLAQTAGQRAAQAGGMGASGNAILEAMNISRGLESANINQYANRLMQMAGYAPQIAGAQAGISGQQAGLSTDLAQRLAGLSVGAGTGAAGLSTGQAGALSGLATGEAGALAGLYSDTSGALANTYQQQADAQRAAASNVWNAILGVAGLGLKAVTPTAGKMPSAGGGSFSSSPVGSLLSYAQG